MKSNYLCILSMFLFSTLLGSCNYVGKKMALSNFKDVDPTQFEAADVKEYTSVENEPVKIRIPDWKEDHMLKLSTLFSEIEYVKLSNEPDALIGDINKMVVKDSFVYILDRWKTKSLKKFTRKGDYIATIGTAGPGPEEYFEPTDFIVSNDEIIVSDQFKSDLKYYDLSGHFKYARKVPFIFLKFFFFSPNHYVFHAIDADNYHLKSILNWSVYETDSLFRINYRGFFRPKDKYISYLAENNFSPYNDTVFFHPPFNDTIYSINSAHRIQAEYILEFPEGKLPERYLLKENSNESRKVSNEGLYATFSGNYVPMKDYLYFEYNAKRMIHHVVYSKKTNKIILGNQTINDINYMFQYANILTSTEDNILVGYMQSYLIGDYFGKTPRNKWVEFMGEKYTQIAENIKSEDNPILLFFKIKDF